MTEGTAKFFLLQVNDALFPIGGYSHSYGLETYIQKGIVHDEDSAQEFIHKRLKYNFSYNEFMAVRLAFEYALREDLKQFPVWKRSWKPGRFRVRQERQAENWDPDLSRPCRHWSFLYRTVFLINTERHEREKACITRWPMVSSVEQQESPKTKHWNILSMHRPLRWSQTA